MKLYHYTSVTLGEAILSDAIRHGHLMHSDGTMSQGVVWLTTDPRPHGHGLTLGTEKMDANAIAHQERVAGGPIRNSHTLDKTELRITVELAPNATPWLMPFMEYCKVNEPKGWAKSFGVSCLTNMRTASDKELKRLLRHATTKETTWWLSFNPVATEAFVSVDFNVKGKFEPYDFERHGRTSMHRYGFTFPSPAALAEVAEIIAPSHRFEQPKAFVFCEDPNKPPKVAVRGGSTVRAFEIGTRTLVVGADDDKSVALRAWIARHKDELQACWAEAVELFYNFYPDRRTGALTTGT